MLESINKSTQLITIIIVLKSIFLVFLKWHCVFMKGATNKFETFKSLLNTSTNLANNY